MMLEQKLQSHIFFEDPFEFLFSLKEKTIKQNRHHKTLRFELNDRGFFAKLHYGIGWKEIFKNLVQLRLPIFSARSEWLALQRLHELNIATMNPVAFGCKGKNPAKLKSFLVTEELTNVISLEKLCENWRQEKPSFIFKTVFIQSIAAIAKKLHENGVNHRDFYICHFLYDFTQAKPVSTKDKLTLYLIDLHRAQLRKKTPVRWLIKDISGLFFSAMDLNLTKRDLLRFVKYYSGGSLRKALTKNATFWHKVHTRAIKLYQKIHGKNPDVAI